MRRSRYNRDALYNLSNTYLALKNGPKLLATAERLVAIEPLNENVAQAPGRGLQRQSKKIDSAVKTAEQVLALPVDVEVTDFAPTASRGQADRHGHRPCGPDAGGQADRADAGHARLRVPRHAGDGVVATQEAQVPALKAGASQDDQGRRGRAAASRPGATSRSSSSRQAGRRRSRAGGADHGGGAGERRGTASA